MNTEFTDDLGVPVADQGFGQDLIVERGLRGTDVSDDANRDKIEFADEVSNTGLSIDDLLVGELILDRAQIGREGDHRSLDITYTGTKLNVISLAAGLGS